MINLLFFLSFLQINKKYKKISENQIVQQNKQTQLHLGVNSEKLS